MRFIAVMFLCLNGFAYEYIEGQKLPTTLTYSCDDPILEDSFKRMFAIWNFACDGIFTLSKADSGATIKVVLNPSLPGGLAGYTRTAGASATLEIKSNTFELDAFALHEIGHCLGLAHTKTVHSIMNADAKSEATLIQDDIDGVRELYGLSPKTFDFKMTVKGRGVSARSPYGKVDWSASDLWIKNRADHIRHRCALGLIEIEMTYRGISVYKTIEIKRRNQF